MVSEIAGLLNNRVTHLYELETLYPFSGFDAKWEHKNQKKRSKPFFGSLKQVILKSALQIYSNIETP